MRKNLSDIYNEMWYEEPSTAMFPKELLENVTYDRFALNDYTKLIYESTDIFDYLDELIVEGSHGGQKSCEEFSKRCL